MIRWMNRKMTTGTFAARPMGGARRAVLSHDRDWLLARIASVPGLTIRALRAEWAERGTVVCKDAVWRFLRNEGLTFKKACA